MAEMMRVGIETVRFTVVYTPSKLTFGHPKFPMNQKGEINLPPPSFLGGSEKSRLRNHVTVGCIFTYKIPLYVAGFSPNVGTFTIHGASENHISSLRNVANLRR